MYYLNKIVGWCTSPLGVMFLSAAFSWLLYHYGKKKMAMWISVIVLVFFWIMGCGITTRIIGVGLERSWEYPGKVHGDITGLPQADAIVILGGGMAAHAKCGAPEMFGGADRVWLGARLYKAGLSKIVSLSGPDVEKSTVPLMDDLGVPREAFMYFPEARNTEEESKLIFVALSKIFGKRKPRILLVTSAWHMSRSKLLFERVGFEVIPAPTDFEMSYILESPMKTGDFFPSVESLVRNTYALKEWVARLGYGMLRR